MERVSFNIEREEFAEALHAEAAAHGRSVSEEALALVEQGLAGKVRRVPSDDSKDWARFLDLGRRLNLENGLDDLIPPRTPENYTPPEL
jgi:plasmid stability protein